MNFHQSFQKCSILTLGTFFDYSTNRNILKRHQNVHLGQTVIFERGIEADQRGIGGHGGLQTDLM